MAKLLDWKFRFLICAIFSLSIFLKSETVHGQNHITKEISLKIIDELNNLKRSNKIHDSAYVKSVFEWIETQSSMGFYYERNIIEKKLEILKDIVSKDMSQQGSLFLINYYLSLFDNAAFSRRHGEALYYIEKADKEIAKRNAGKSLKSVAYRAELYNARKNYQMVKSLYTENRDYMLSTPQLLEDKKLDLNIALDMCYGLKHFAESFAKLQDSTALNEIVNLSQQLSDIFKVQIRKETLHYLLAQFLNQNVKFEKAINQSSQRQDSENILFVQDSIIVEARTKFPSHPYVGQLQYSTLVNKISYFYTTQQIDSTLHYLQSFFKLPHIDPEQTLNYKKLFAEILFKQGESAAAFEALNSIFSSRDSLYNIALDEQDSLQYAYIIAEDRQNELLAAEKEKLFQSRLIFVVSILSIIGISILYWLYTRKSRKVKHLIEELNNNTNIQVSVIEEIKSQAVKEERQRLGRNLHDDISASIASIKLRLEQIHLSDVATGDAGVQSILKNVEAVYHKVRGMSNEWYYASAFSTENLFSAQIASITDALVSNSNYEININIDDESLRATSMDMRIELLRIIQEGITNIVKHAKAKKIDILLYEDNEQIVLSIKDDGIGLKRNNRNNGLGLQSIQDRADGLGALLSIEEIAPQGTEILIEIPLKKRWSE